MRVLPIHVIPIFLSTSLPGEAGAQVRMFDVFYKNPPVVGWHVAGAVDDGCDVVGFCAQGDPPEDGLAGFTVSEDSAAEGVAGFVVGDCDDDNT